LRAGEDRNRHNVLTAADGFVFESGQRPIWAAHGWGSAAKIIMMTKERQETGEKKKHGMARYQAPLRRRYEEGGSGSSQPPSSFGTGDKMSPG
jgi:hypothetical protein